MLCHHSIIIFNIRKGALLIIIAVHEFWHWKSHNRYKYWWGARVLILYSRYRYLKVIASALLLIQFQNGLKSRGNFYYYTVKVLPRKEMCEATAGAYSPISRVVLVLASKY